MRAPTLQHPGAIMSTAGGKRLYNIVGFNASRLELLYLRVRRQPLMCCSEVGREPL